MSTAREAGASSVGVQSVYLILIHGVIQRRMSKANRSVDTISAGYSLTPIVYVQTNSNRNALGLFGGNETSVVRNRVDLESDLFGITRDLSNAPSKKFHPESSEKPAMFSLLPAIPQIVFLERSTGLTRTIDATLNHLPTKQYVSYPGVPAPDPMRQEVFGSPWRF